MALHDKIRSNIMRQELQLIEAGQHYKSFSARVKYLPENIEKEDFFKLVYGMVTKCDELNIHTYKQGSHDVFYKFIVTSVNFEKKEVNVKRILKVDFLKNNSIEDFQEENTEVIEENTEVIKDGSKAIPISEVEKIIQKVAEDLTTKLQTHIEEIEKYQKDTDDQLEEIEKDIAALKQQEE